MGGKKCKPWASPHHKRGALKHFRKLQKSGGKRRPIDYSSPDPNECDIPASPPGPHEIVHEV